MKSHSATADWKRLQLRFLDVDDIACDHDLKVFMKQHPDWQYHVDYASADLKLYSKNYLTVDHDRFDFFIINHLEFGKLNLSQIENTIKNLYQRSQHGGYFSVQSYFLNWNNHDSERRLDLSDDIDQAVIEWVERYIGVENYSNQSLKISNPLSNVTDDGKLLSGSDFMYTHGNIRFWLWKK